MKRRDGVRLNIHFYPSAFRFESRMLKTTASAVASGAVDEVLIIARWEPGLDRSERIDERRSVVRIPTPLSDRLPGRVRRIARILEWQLRMVTLMVRHRPSIINPHSLPVLPLALLVRLLTRAAVVYDTHELETETIGASSLRRHAGKLIERFCVPRCSAVTVVNGSIGRWYADHHPGVRIVVVRNIPQRSQQPRTRLLRESCGIPDDHMLFLYQGTIDPGRAISLVLEAFASVEQNRHVVFMGYGSLVAEVQAAAKAHSNIHFHPAVPPADVLAYTASADVGLCIIENVSLSYYLSLPNKLFEYISVGVPAIVSDFPEMSAVVDELHAGWVVPVEGCAIAKLMATLTPDEIALASQEVSARAASLSWETEAADLIDMYRSLSSAAAQ